MATPFVQGRLREEHLSVTIATECAHCGLPLHIEVDSALQCRVAEARAEPLVFLPQINWATFTDSNIIDAY
jgi:hypothetical protein